MSIIKEAKGDTYEAVKLKQRYDIRGEEPAAIGEDELDIMVPEYPASKLLTSKEMIIPKLQEEG